MKTTILSFANQLVYIIVTVLSLGTNEAQNSPFYCDSDAYLFQHNDVYSIDLASGNSVLAASNITPGSINATAYNPADGYIWGSLNTPKKTIVRISQDFRTTSFYIDELPTTSNFVGGISASGVYCLKGSRTTYYRIDLNPASKNYTKYIGTANLSQNLRIHDWAFNAVDGYICC